MKKNILFKPSISFGKERETCSSSGVKLALAKEEPGCQEPHNLFIIYIKRKKLHFYCPIYSELKINYKGVIKLSNYDDQTEPTTNVCIIFKGMN